MKTRRLVLLALLTAIALTIFMLEAQIPAPVPIPGVKLGLSNIVTVFTVFLLGPGEGCLVLAARIFLGAVFAGNFSTILYSAAGGGLAILVTILLRRVLKESALGGGLRRGCGPLRGANGRGGLHQRDAGAAGLPAHSHCHQPDHRTVHRAVRPVFIESRKELLENYFEMNLDKGRIDAISNLGLAHIGDGVFELLCRSYLCEQGYKTVLDLHKKTVALVNAPAQAEFVDKLLPLLNEAELSYYRRGKNAHVHAVPKGATPAQYAKATGLEALFGALYLAGKTGRINELFRAVMEGEDHGL